MSAAQDRPLTARDAATWSVVARRTPARSWRRSAVRVLLVALTMPGLLQLGAIVRWALRTGATWALVPLAVHLGVIALALGLPARPPSPAEDPPGFLGRLRATYGARADRLRALRLALACETGALGLYPPLLLVLTGQSPRWGVTFVIALCALTVLWPLERIARAQRRESERLERLG